MAITRREATAYVDDMITREVIVNVNVTSFSAQFERMTASKQ